MENTTGWMIAHNKGIVQNGKVFKYKKHKMVCIKDGKK